ncbi:MAG: glycoside hydrolase family 47 protein [Chitinophagaceae bacterium]|nr:MAG: glycoside hydrolase family 47 protein [Chitinophagaceae bacterium]
MNKFFLVLSASFLIFAGVGCHSSGNKNATSSADSITALRQRLADSVKQEFSYAWDSYVKYAWGHDGLKPLSHSYFDWYPHSLVMTPLDGYDTMVLMGLTSKADSAKRLILDSLRFNYDMSVSNFEITIRMLGGLLSAYELDGDKKFLTLATDLANRLIKAYHSPTGMPYRFVNLKTGKTTGDTSNPAEIGTSLLEYGTLTKLTGDSIYYKTAKKAVVTLFNLRNKKTGLVGDAIDVNTGKWVGKESSISGGTDSYYEYLLKAWKLFGDQDCKRMWDSTVIAINTHLADTSGGTLWYGHANMDTGIINLPYYGALDAFFGGALALGGDTTRAKSLQESNFKMWELAGLEPEVLNYRTMQIVNGYYALRPENLESCYYCYHYTHNPEYLYMARTMFQSIVRYCRTGGGYAAIKDVRNMTPDDMMESYFLAETLKYAYLIFAPAKTLDFNKVIFNTEAHPFKISDL